jgi:GxxExxY protein
MAESVQGGESEQRPDPLLYRQLSFDVIGCAQRVHAALGPGFPERVYQRALCDELRSAGIVFATEVEFQVRYRGKVVGKFRADVVVDGKILVENKAVSDFHEDHVAQCFAYLKASGLKVALLINFGKRHLEHKRFVMERRTLQQGDSPQPSA